MYANVCSFDMFMSAKREKQSREIDYLKLRNFLLLLLLVSSHFLSSRESLTELTRLTKVAGAID